ncbi:MAG: penicillin-binding transpeptidase domain-containing protein [Pseudomonadota bacterium]|nr:penicillin-binding transpeptidase domain-containing protein [Pseudomonadota bacterium]
MSRYIHDRSYRTMIDVVGNKSKRRRARLSSGGKRLVIMGTLLMFAWALWTSDDSESSATHPHDGEINQTGVLSSAELVPNYLLAQMTPLNPDSASTREQEVPLEESGVEVALANLVSTPKASKYSYQDAGLSLKLQRLLDDYRVPDGAVIVLDTVTGEIAGLAGVRGGMQDHSAAFEAKWPAASLFKTVTASALLKAGKAPTRSCYDVGYRRMRQRDLRKSSGRTCADLTLAYGRSYNIHFGQWAKRWLSPATLEKEARHLGFGAKSWVPGHRAEQLNLPSETVAFANTAAGFGDAAMSPYQAALISAAIGNGGTTKVVDPKSGKLRETRRLFSGSVAGKLKSAMEATIVRGSARKAFRAHGKPALGKLGAGGKTGSLMAEGRDLTWFSGFAPLDEPRYAVAVMIANHPTWHVKAPYVAREALRAALVENHTPYRPSHLLATH